MSTPTASEREQSFAETALRLSGKTEEEARRTGALDKADEQVEKLFQLQYQTVNSPIHKAVWDGKVPLSLFNPPSLPPADASDTVMEACLQAVRKRPRRRHHATSMKMARSIPISCGELGSAPATGAC